MWKALVILRIVCLKNNAFCISLEILNKVSSCKVATYLCSNCEHYIELCVLLASNLPCLGSQIRLL